MPLGCRSPSASRAVLVPSFAHRPKPILRLGILLYMVNDDVNTSRSRTEIARTKPRYIRTMLHHQCNSSGCETIEGAPCMYEPENLLYLNLECGWCATHRVKSCCHVGINHSLLHSSSDRHPDVSRSAGSVASPYTSRAESMKNVRDEGRVGAEDATSFGSVETRSRLDRR